MPGDWEFLKWLWGVLVPYNIYLHRRIDKAVEEQKDSVKREEFSKQINVIRNEIAEGNRQVTDRIDRLMTLLLDKLK